MTVPTHLLISWLVAAKTTDNRRDCRLVALAGILPDADGFGLAVDYAGKASGLWDTAWYVQYHHWLLHGLFGGALVSATLAGFARRRAKVALLAFLVFHVHLLCDVAGSAAGPHLADLWPLHYLGPFSQRATILWTGQWSLDSGLNKFLTVVLLGWALLLAAKRGDSFIGVFHLGLDAKFSGVLQHWRAVWLARQVKK